VVARRLAGFECSEVVGVAAAAAVRKRETRASAACARAGTARSTRAGGAATIRTRLSTIAAVVTHVATAGDDDHDEQPSTVPPLLRRMS
jgi:hypothetical protein